MKGRPAGAPRGPRPRRLDVVIVGAGPAGLSAALVLGRCRRQVLVCDAGRPRNAASRAMHGFLSRDGITPLDLLRIGREQLRPYETVEVRDVEVTDVKCVTGGFETVLRGGARVSSRHVLLATGVVDRLPRLEGLEPLWGRSVFHCPYCDAWEVRDRPLAVYGRRRQGLSLALKLTAWSRDVVLCTDGPGGIRAEDRKRLARHRVGLREEPISRLEGRDGILERIVFRKGEPLERRALFVSVGHSQRSHLPLKLGCRFTRSGAVSTGRFEVTSVPDLFVAGDASRDVQLAVVAAAEGARAAFAINEALIRADLAEREAGGA